VTVRLLLLLALATFVAGCGNKIETRTVGETEGLYIDIGDLKYQVQESRILNSYEIEDKAYLAGLPDGTVQPTPGEAWFGVWLRVENTTSDKTLPTAHSFQMVDTQEHKFQPVELRNNPFAYAASNLGPNSVFPNPNSPAGEGVIQGSLLLFKVTTEALANRPIEFKIENPQNATEVGIVDLDI